MTPALFLSRRFFRLNRNILECKYATNYHQALQDASLNRNILECKFIPPRPANCAPAGLNRNILECKLICTFSIPERKPVLIETYWNVNRFRLQGSVSAD